jgi:hypothetical protein
MSTYNLPALDYNPMPAPTGHGVWEVATDLRGLSKSLRVANTTAKIDEIKSIPDAWSQAQLCGQALLDPTHELHDEIVAQWRGLLALFALQPLYADDYDLEILPIDLADHKNGERRFRRVLQDLLPSITLSADVDWRHAGVILLRDKSGGAFSRGELTPVGQLSPWTLVSPGKLASQVQFLTVPWLQAGLTDPTAASGLSSDHFSALARYLEQLGGALGAAGALRHDHELYSQVRDLLGSFSRACVSKIVEPATLKEQALRLDWPSPFYQALGTAWGIDDKGIPDGDSRVRLSTREAMAELFEGVILIDPDLEKTFKLSPEAIRVWERSTLRDAQSPAGLAKIKAEATAKGYLIVEPADFFTTKLIKFNAGVDIPAHPQSFRGALLPLSPLALMLLDRDALASAITLSDRGGKHVVTLKLPLAYDARRERVTQHDLVMTYDDADVQVEDRPDDLALWPNFQSPDWPWTFLHYQYDPEYELQPRFALSAEFIREDVLAQARGRPDRERAMREWSSANALVPDRRISAERVSELKDRNGRTLLHRLRFADTPRLVGEMQRLPRGAEAIFFARREDGPRSERPVGCALIESPQMSRGQTDAAVSIDFGTTNTIAYTKRGDKLEPVRFQDRILFPIRMAQNEAEQRERLIEAYTDFFPLRAYETPIPTVAKRRDFKGAAPAALKSSLSGGHDAVGFTDAVFFVPTYDKFDGTASILAWIASDQLVFGIKWAKDEPTRRLTKRYLRQIMMMTAAELVAAGIDPDSIRWRFSYPQAFSRQDKGSLENFIEQAWTDLFADRTQLKGDDRKEVVRLETESAAAIRYFIADGEKKNAGVGELILMLDVGGGTTDVAVAHRGQIKWKNSFKLAGGDFFTRYLSHNFNILRRIDFNEVASFVESDAGKNPEGAASFVELFVNAPTFTESFQRSYPAFEAEAEGMGLRQCASTALGGLLYYMGLVIGQFIRDGHLEPSDLAGLTIAFGGRGSALFRQFDRGERYDTDLSRLCGLVVAAAGQDPSSIKITTLFSDQPKHEVAHGLLIASGPPAKAGNAWAAAPLGEAVSIRGSQPDQVLGPNSQIGELLLAHDIRGVELRGFDDFLAALKRQSGIGIDLASRDGEGSRLIQRATADGVRKALAAITPEDLEQTETQSIEPPFITALKSLIGVMNMPVAERDRRIAVTDTPR